MPVKGLPPLNSLVMFEVAARYCSFTLAAEELCVTQVAVSRQIQKLEEYIGRRLFIRNYRQLKLTKVGEEYASSIRYSLTQVVKATQQARHYSSRLPQQLKIVAGQCFSAFWLMPRLHIFHQQYPDIQIHLHVNDNADVCSENDYDIAFFYSEKSEGLARWYHLFNESVLPVCSPKYLAQCGGHILLENIWKYSLLMVEGWPKTWETWETWAKHEGLSYQSPHKTVYLAEQTLIVEAAIQHCGIALVWDWHVRDLLKRGELVSLVDTYQKRRGGFYLVPSSLADSDVCQLFLNWVKNEIMSEHR